jgi:hypothetical protein
VSADAADRNYLTRMLALAFRGLVGQKSPAERSVVLERSVVPQMVIGDDAAAAAAQADAYYSLA